MAKRIYIAGPMRGYPLFNFPAFDAARDQWKAKGYEVVSPADMDRELDGLDPVKTDPADVFPFEHYIRRDIEALLKVDAVAFLDGWRDSLGARIEWAVANSLNLELYQSKTGEKLRSGPTTLLQRYQRQVARNLYMKEMTPRSERISHATLGLCGEAGEVADIIKKSQYKTSDGAVDNAHILEELGDVLWYLTYLAHQFGASLEDLAIANINKLAARHPGNYTPLREFPV